MKWLPSFVKLFSLFILGFVLQIAGSIGMIRGEVMSSDTGVFASVRLLGLLLMVVALLLIGLKFFSRLDQKS
ncbi:hypothetical protein [Hymenobacter glacieicola]|uniref:DUF1328 domain-containing protein n=1 Tax=Hymenobacter glacieicola TaxID=1562124 RepID=A0ABQ1WL75_9BACT|nr:hypothetical protein [Hymenobacter glacieicola]GGG36310.1 hypothetical protein GCM10011378_10850 [Hymenobacter glacieicola]